jgi:hypothetical protein
MLGNAGVFRAFLATTTGVSSMGECPDCNGSGCVTDAEPIPCPACDATGLILGAPCICCDGDGQQVVDVNVLCDRCGGRGEV